MVIVHPVQIVLEFQMVMLKLMNAAYVMVMTVHVKTVVVYQMVMIQPVMVNVVLVMQLYHPATVTVKAM